MKTLKKELACNITLISILVLTFAYMILLSFNLFGVITIAIPDYFNYIFAYVLIGISLLFYIFSFFYTSRCNFEFPTWLQIMFYIAFFVFTNVYYFSGLFENLVAVIIMFAYLSFIIMVASLSIFYNAQKDEGNRLKATRRFIITSTALYSLGFQLVLMFLVQTIKIIAFRTSPFNTLKMFVIESATMIGVTIVVTLLFWLSLRKSKKFINACLVRYDSSTEVKKSVKSKNKYTV